MSPLLDVVLKSSVIVAAALGTATLLRRRSAALRHWVIAVGVLAAASLPAIRLVTPGWTLLDPSTLPAQPASSSIAWVDGQSAAKISSATSATEPLDVGQLVRAVWIGGTAASLAVLFFGLARLRSLTRRATRVNGPAWSEIAGAIGVSNRVTLLESDRPNLPITWGVRRPAIILPSDSRAWSAETRRIVLLHEHAHIRRADWLMLVVAEVVRAMYWFNPLVWLACRRLRAESERACDDAVLRDGVPATAYAEQLLAVARSALERRSFLDGPAAAMARGSTLERRFSAMLNRHLNRRPASRFAKLTTAASVLVFAGVIAGYGMTREPALAADMPRDLQLGPAHVSSEVAPPAPARITQAAGLRPAASLNQTRTAAPQFYSFVGTVFDLTNRVLPGVTVTLTNTTSQTKYEVRTDGNGRYEFVGLPSGNYTWQTALPGFATSKGSIAITGNSLQQDVQLQLGTVSEIVTVRRPSQPDPVPQTVSVAPTAIPPMLPWDCRGVTNPAPTGTLQIGGVIRAPTKITHISPRYPEAAYNAGIGGVVILDSVVDVNGLVTQVRALNSPPPELVGAAEDAVRQWRFNPTLLNCMPLETRYMVTVSFIAQ